MFYEIVQRCPDGSPELACPHDTAPVLGGPLAGGHPAPAVSPKPMHHSSWHGPEDTLVPSTLAVQHPQLTCLDALPSPARVQLNSPGPLHTSVGHKEAHCTFSSTSHVLRTSKDNIAKSVREHLCFQGKKYLHVFLLVDCFLFAFSPSPRRSHSKEHRGPRALGPSWVSVLPAAGTGAPAQS